MELEKRETGKWHRPECIAGGKTEAVHEFDVSELVEESGGTLSIRRSSLPDNGEIGQRCRRKILKEA